jgi:hypothetical protein
MLTSLAIVSAHRCAHKKKKHEASAQRGWLRLRDGAERRTAQLHIAQDEAVMLKLSQGKAKVTNRNDDLDLDCRIVIGEPPQISTVRVRLPPLAFTPEFDTARLVLHNQRSLVATSTTPSSTSCAVQEATGRPLAEYWNNQ